MPEPVYRSEYDLIRGATPPDAIRIATINPFAWGWLRAIRTAWEGVEGQGCETTLETHHLPYTVS